MQESGIEAVSRTNCVYHLNLLSRSADLRRSSAQTRSLGTHFHNQDWNPFRQGINCLVGVCDPGNAARLSDVREKDIYVWKYLIKPLPAIIGIVVRIQRNSQTSGSQFAEEFRDVWKQPSLQVQR